MTKKEAFEEILNGEKVTLITWEKNEYMYMTDNGNIHINNNDNYKYQCNNYNFYPNDGWVIYEEDKITDALNMLESTYNLDKTATITNSIILLLLNLYKEKNENESR